MSVIKQKGKCQNEMTRKQRTPSFPKNEHFLPSNTHTYVCVSGDKCSFFGKLGVLCFLVTSVLRFAPFVLLPTTKRFLSVFFEDDKRLLKFISNLSIKQDWTIILSIEFFSKFTLKHSRYYLQFRETSHWWLQSPLLFHTTINISTVNTGNSSWSLYMSI